MNARARRFSFTLNNPGEGELRSLQTLDIEAHHVRYLLCGEEVGESGTPHIQGYIELLRPTRLAGLKNIPGLERAHFEASRGTPQDNVRYCSKEGRILCELGSISSSSQGRRCDLDQVKAAIDRGESLEVLAENHFASFVRYHRGIGLALSLRQPPRDFRTQGVYMWGPTGSGKSRRAHAESFGISGGQVFWCSDPALRWFDGLTPTTKALVVDDFAGAADIQFLLRLLDRYPLRVPIKGGFVEFRVRIIWFTSNYHLSHWYGDKGEHYNALLRRFDEIIFIE